MTEIILVECHCCNGQGYIEYTETGFVTDDEAIDAGDFGLRGQSYKVNVKETCIYCGGDGFLAKPKAQP